MSRTTGFDYTNKDYEAFRNMMLNALDVKMPEYTDKRQSDAGVVILELLAQGLDILSFYQDVIANEVFLVTEEQRSNALKWCQMLGHTPRFATPARFKQVFVLSSPQATETLIPAGTVVKTLRSSVEPEVAFETVADHIIPAGKLGDESVDGEYLYTVEIVQGTSVHNELLGTSSATSDQVFSLRYSPVIVPSIEVRINEGDGFRLWERVDNFVESTPTSRHYTASLDDVGAVRLTFGNGVFGKIPQRFTNGMYCTYRVGGGSEGNVGAGKINVLDSNIAVVAKTFNPDKAFEYGQDKESLEEIKVNAPNAFRTMWGALTLEDFADVVALNFPEVKYAISKRNEDNIDDLHIYLLLQDGEPLTDSIRNKIFDLLDENKGGRKIVGADNVYIEPATLVPLSFEAVLVVKDNYSKDSVEQGVNEFFEKYFAVGSYPFNTELSLSELVSLLMSEVAGIKSFRVTSPVDDILVPALNEIYILDGLILTVSGGV